MKTIFAMFNLRCLTILAGISISMFIVSSAWAQTKSPTHGRAQSVHAPLMQVPESARTRKNPFEGNARETAAGGKLFDQHCSDCHGKKAGGTRRGPSLLQEEVQQATPGALFWILTNGVVRRGMPVWSKLPEQERWQIVTFVQSLKSQTTGSPDIR